MVAIRASRRLPPTAAGLSVRAAVQHPRKPWRCCGLTGEQSPAALAVEWGYTPTLASLFRRSGAACGPALLPACASLEVAPGGRSPPSMPNSSDILPRQLSDAITGGRPLKWRGRAGRSSGVPHASGVEAVLMGVWLIGPALLLVAACVPLPWPLTCG